MDRKECGCPIIVDEEWEGKTFSWKDRTFFAQPVKFFFRAPIDVEEQVGRAGEAMEKRGYMLEEPLTVLIEEGQFAGRVLIGILPPETPDPHVVTMGDVSVVGTVVARKEPKLGVKTLKGFKERLELQGRKVKQMYVWHVTCPTCSRLEGFKSVVFAEIC